MLGPKGSRISIDWEEVAKFLVAGCRGAEVAAYLGINAETLYRRCKKDLGREFIEYVAEKRQKGNSLLMLKQFQVAMSGNVPMLIWSGKQRLGQEDKPKKDEEFNGVLKELLDELKNLKAK